MLKKSNIWPIHKKGDNQVINDYRPVSLLPICRKVFERLIFTSVYEYLEEHKWLSADQIGFRANDSCVNQLLSIVHNIYSAFDAYPSVESCVIFWICPSFLIKYDMRDLFLNLSQLVFQRHRTCQKLFDKQVPASCTEWLYIRVVTTKSRCSTRIHFMSALFCNTH